MKGYNEILTGKKELSDKLWQPVGENFNDVNLCDCGSHSDNIMNNSWFSCTRQYKYKKNQIQKLKIESPDINIEKGQLRIKTIRLKLSKYLEKKIKEGIFVTRMLYNKCVELCCKTEPPIPVNQKILRNLLACGKKSSESIFTKQQKEDFSKVPSAIRDEAISDFIKAYFIQIELLKKGKIKHFDMGYKKRKDKLQESIVIVHKDLKKKENGDYYIYPIKWDKYEILDTYKEKLPSEIKHDCRLIMKTIGNNEKFYLAIPADIETNPKVKKLNAVSLDPGIKIFQTTYDTEGSSYLIGENDVDKLDNMSKIAARMRDGIKRIVTNSKNKFYKTFDEKERKGLLKAAENIERKIKNKISDLHRKTAKFLCDKYDTIIIPEFRVKQMSEKKNEDGNWKRKIGKETTRKMIRWGHYQFRQLLIAKGKATGINVYIGTEEYTSKTCGNCFYIDNNLGGKRIFNCEKCNHLCHRDINAARNIMLLNFEKSGLKTFVPKITLNISKK